MIAVLAFFNCIVYYRFIKNHVPKEYYWLAVFLYIFYPGFMLIHASAMRQSISIALFIVSIDYIFKKDFIRYIIIIGIAALFHTSAIILLPVYFIGNLNWKIGKKSGFIILIIYISSFYFVRDFDPYLKQFIRLSFSKYETSFDQGQIRSGFGIIYIVSLLILILFYERFQKKKIELLFKLALISFAFNPLSMLIHLITRVGMYFTPATLIVYAIILMNMRTQFSKLIFLVVLVFMNLWSFYKFFSSDIWQQAYSTYHTIFSSNNFY